MQHCSEYLLRGAAAALFHSYSRSEVVVFRVGEREEWIGRERWAKCAGGVNRKIKYKDTLC